MTEQKKCDECRWALLEDYGYSNYTTEGTYVHCLKNLHPESGWDRFYGEDKRLSFAETCAGFERGEPVQIDVDREELKKYEDPLSSAYTTDQEVAKLLDEWERAPR